MEGTLSDAVQAVSTIEIVEEFGIPNRTKNGKTYLLCPGHDDTHFGSCYIDKNDNGYYCYACSEHVPKWAMLRKVSGKSPRDAADWFFQHSGITPTRTANPLAPVMKLVKDLELYIDNSPLYEDQFVCAKSSSSYGRISHGDYFFSELISQNPLLNLYKQSPTVFATTCINALTEKIAFKNRLLKFFKRHFTDASADAYHSLYATVEKEISQMNDLINQLEFYK